jgi:hypothetical protein
VQRGNRQRRERRDGVSRIAEGVAVARNKDIALWEGKHAIKDQTEGSARLRIPRARFRSAEMRNANKPKIARKTAPMGANSFNFLRGYGSWRYSSHNDNAVRIGPKARDSTKKRKHPVKAAKR